MPCAQENVDAGKEDVDERKGIENEDDITSHLSAKKNPPPVAMPYIQ